MVSMRAMVLCCACIGVTLGVPHAADGAPASHGANPFVPSVTAAEARWLAEAGAVAETNAAAAARWLSDAAGEKPGPAVAFTLGNYHLQSDALDAAVAAYGAALKAMPSFRAAAVNLGRVHLLQEEPARTIAVYRRLVRDGGADADAYRLLGHALMMTGAPVGAETAYRNALLQAPDDREAEIGLAKALLRQTRMAEGGAVLDALLTRDPLARDLWTLRAQAYLEQSEHVAAVRTIEQARRIAGVSSDLLATLGDLHLDAGRPEDALTAYREAFAGETPRVARILRAARGFLMVDDVKGAATMADRAGAVLERATEPDRDNHLAWLRVRAETAMRQDRLDDARALCREVLAVDPLDGGTLLTLAELQVRAGRLHEAMLSCERAARVPGFERDALLRHARIEVGREHYDRAVPLLEAAQAFEPTDRVARYLAQVRRLAERMP